MTDKDNMSLIAFHFMLQPHSKNNKVVPHTTLVFLSFKSFFFVHGFPFLHFFFSSLRGTEFLQDWP